MVPDKALDLCNREIELDPGDALAVASRGETYRRMRRYDEALADFNRAIEVNPGYAQAVASRGETYRRMRRYDEALADFSRAIELDPDDSRAIATRGHTYWKVKRYDEALADLNRVVESTPATPGPSPGAVRSTRPCSGTTKPWPTSVGPSSSTPARRARTGPSPPAAGTYLLLNRDDEALADLQPGH